MQQSSERIFVTVEHVIKEYNKYGNKEEQETEKWGEEKPLGI